jgi:zinc finger CCCH domain-containing protein 13
VSPLNSAKGDSAIPPDTRWTKISRRLVNPEALDAGKEIYEAREDFVIALRVLTREEVLVYANATQQIRGNSTNYLPKTLFKAD